MAVEPPACWGTPASGPLQPHPEISLGGVTDHAALRLIDERPSKLSNLGS